MMSCLNFHALPFNEGHHWGREGGLTHWGVYMLVQPRGNFLGGILMYKRYYIDNNELSNLCNNGFYHSLL